MSRAKSAGIYRTPLADTQSYAKRTQSMLDAEQWLKHNDAKQCTVEDNTRLAYQFNGRRTGRVKRDG